MKVGNILVLGAAGVGLYAFFRSARKLTKLDINISSVKLNSKETQIGKDTVLNCQVSAYNPNNQDVTFQYFTGNIYSGSTRIGDIDSTKSKGVILKARQTSYIPVIFKIPNTNILQQIVTTLILPLFGGSKNVTLPESFQVKGSIKVERLPAVAINETIKLKTS
ncbi:MAG: hypothetical protein WC389_13230 [Lutibacter sp.]